MANRWTSRKDLGVPVKGVERYGVHICGLSFYGMEHA
jgi:hypothetical protein